MSEKMIELEVSGIDIFDENVVEYLQDNFPDVEWGFSDGKVIATFFCQDSGLYYSVQEFVRSILDARIGATNIRWHDDLVGYADISRRTGLSSEGIRKWAKGERLDIEFPQPRGHIGSGQHRSPIWAWNEIYACLKEHGKYTEEIDFPTFEEICGINAAITWIKAPSYQFLEVQAQQTFTGVVRDLTGFTVIPNDISAGAR